MRDPDLRGDLVKFAAGELGIHARRIRVGKPRTLRVGDGGFTVNIRVNRKTPIVIGVFRVGRALGEVDARGTRSAGLLTRTRGVLRVGGRPRAAGPLAGVAQRPDDHRHARQVGAALQAPPRHLERRHLVRVRVAAL